MSIQCFWAVNARRGVGPRPRAELARCIVGRPMVGDVIGNYRILGTIGGGGMGTVYVAEHTLIGRRAAIKVLQRELSYRREAVTRFFNEAKAATAVKHPGIVELYDFGYAADGSAYIVMECLEGETLTRRLARVGTLAEATAVALCRQIAGGLGAAHAQGIVHRDLKPENIYIVRDPDIAGGERTKILDFGIAKLPLGASEEQSVTLDGQIVGTPAYMSPEQCKGARSVDRRADLYALGCILFEMVCGRGPFVGEGAGEVMAQHIYMAVPAPSSLRPVTPALEQVILRALAKDPAHRFQSAEEMSEALQAAMVSAPVALATGQPMIAAAHIGFPSNPAIALPQQTTLSQASGATVQVAPVARAPWRAIAIAAAIVGGVAIAAGVLRAGQSGTSPVAAHEPTTQATTSSASTEPSPATTPVAATPPAATPPVATPPAATPPAAAEMPAASGAAATASKQIKVRLTSDPPGADVFRAPEGVRIGATPLTYTMDATSGKVMLTLKRSGYTDTVIAVPGDRDHEQLVALAKRAAKAPPRDGARGPAGDAPSAGGSLDPFDKLDRKKPEGKQP
ncbi:MAG TPA: serine/threonine-protein kinase [Kofleriaceae bacterium]